MPLLESPRPTAISIGLDAPLASARCVSHISVTLGRSCASVAPAAPLLRGHFQPGDPSFALPLLHRLPLLLQEIWFDTPITNYQGIGRGIQTCRLIFPQPDNSSLPWRHLELAARTMIERWLASLESGVEAIDHLFILLLLFLPSSRNIIKSGIRVYRSVWREMGRGYRSPRDYVSFTRC